MRERKVFSFSSEKLNVESIFAVTGENEPIVMFSLWWVSVYKTRLPEENVETFFYTDVSYDIMEKYQLW